jgi:hypothetical protein
VIVVVGYSKYSLFEKRVSSLRHEFVEGLERKCPSEVLRSAMGGIEVFIRYFTVFPIIVVFLGDEPLFVSKWVYSEAVSGANYERYLDEHFSGEDGWEEEIFYG